MICPRCGKAIMLLKRIEHRGNETVYVYECPKCRYRIEVSYRVGKPRVQIYRDERVAWADQAAPARV